MGSPVLISWPWPNSQWCGCGSGRLSPRPNSEHSVATDGAEDDEQNETKDRRGAEGSAHRETHFSASPRCRRARTGIAAWFAFSNIRRPHQALGNSTPMAVWREGTTVALPDSAVDMMDNARVLPTCPQWQTPALRHGRMTEQTVRAGGGRDSN